LGLWDDDELGLWVAALNFASSGDVVVDIVEFVDVPDDTDLWFVLKESVDESVQIGVPEVVVEHPDGEAEVLILRLLIPTVFPKARKEAEFESVHRVWKPMEERDVVYLSGRSEDGATNGDGDAMLAGVIVVLVGGARTGGWHAVDDTNQVSMLARVVVAAVGHDDGIAGELELEGLVLSAFPDTIRERQS